MCLEPRDKLAVGSSVLTVVLVAVVGASLVQATGAPEGITSYGLHTEAPPWVSLTWLQKEVKFPGPVSHLTVCFHLRLHFLYTDPSLVFHMDGAHFAVVYEGAFALFNAKYFWSTQEAVRLREWRHVCFLLGSEAAVYVQGRYVPGERQGHDGHPPFFVEPRNLTLGVPGGLTDLTHMAPVGAFYTLPVIFYRKLSDEEVLALAGCQAVPDGEVSGGAWRLASTDGEDATLIQREPGLTRDTLLLHTLSTYDASQLDNLTRSAVVARVEGRAVCSHNPPQGLLLVMAAKHQYQAAERLCALYGGWLPHLLPQDMLEALRQMMSVQPNMMLFAWMKSTGDSSCRSVTLPTRQDTPLHMSVGCGHTADKLLCQTPWSPRVELRHTGPVGVDDRFYLVPREMLPRFLSPRGRQISLITPEVLAMHDSEGTLLATAFIGVLQPMGRHVWQEARANISRTMVLTTCQQDEFTCDDGWCIPLSSRCNGVNDCGDDSDELCSVLLPLPSSYRKDRPPLPRTPLALTAHLVRIHDVDVVNNHITVWLQLTTQWRDGSVRLSQLSKVSLDNILMPEGQNKIWTPRYALTNAVFHDRISYDQHHNSFAVTFASKMTDGTVDYIEGFEGYVYNASTDAILERQEDFMAACICDFDLTIFPFDVHECHINISIMNRGTFYSTFEPESFWVKSSPSTLTLFEASELRYLYGSSNGTVDTISFRVLLQRQFGAYVLTTFLPCWVLSIIGFGTLYFRFTDFSDRISVTLSCLIVIAALYSQITFTIPQSSSPKLIDVYFFYFIVRLFKTFVHHSVLYLIGNYERRQNRKRYDVNEDCSTEEDAALERDDRDFRVASETRTEAAVNAATNPHDPASRRSPTFLPQVEGTPSKPSRSYERYFNLVGIGLGIGTDIVCIGLFFYWIFSSRERVISKFNESLK